MRSYRNLTSLLAYDVSGDYESLDFRGAFINLYYLCIPKIALNFVIFHAPIAAMDLYRLGGSAHGNF